MELQGTQIVKKFRERTKVEDSHFPILKHITMLHQSKQYGTSIEIDT